MTKQQNWRFLNGQEHQSNYKQFQNILLMTNQCLHQESLFMTIFTRPKLAILALNYQCLALAQNSLQLVVVCSYVHLRLMLSIVEFVQDSFTPVILSGPWSICLRCIIYGCSSSLIKFLLCLIGLNMVNPIIN